MNPALEIIDMLHIQGTTTERVVELICGSEYLRSPVTCNIPSGYGPIFYGWTEKKKKISLISFAEIQNHPFGIHLASPAVYMKCCSCFLSHTASLSFSLWLHQHNPKKSSFQGLTPLTRYAWLCQTRCTLLSSNTVINIVDPKLTWRLKIRFKTTWLEAIKISLC